MLSLPDPGAAQQAAIYTERYRPRYHFTPAVHWMNDPNGMVYLDGEYHLFYQHNPFGITWGHMSWGHAVSRDLVHWEHLPVALPEADGIMVFSGSAVVDWHNTSGFGQDGRPPLVAIYTGHHTDPDHPRQDQRLAFSTDNGRTWISYRGNPVLDRALRDFRDPKVFWYAPEAKWVMVLALPMEHRVQFYGSPDLKTWTHLSDFGPAGAVGGIWECPDLFELPVDGDPQRTRWVLVVNLNPGGPAGGSAGQYFIGHFDGTTFVPDDPVPVGDAHARWLDYGADYYAAVSWSDVPGLDGERLMIGWMNDWRYANDIPTTPWRSAQSLPRRVMLRAGDGAVRLVQRPVAALSVLRRRQHHVADLPIPEDGVDLSSLGIAGTTLELIAEIEVGRAEVVGLKVRVGADEETWIGYDAAAARLFVDRTHAGEAGFHPAFAARHTAPLAAADGRVRLHVFVDASSVEVFGGAGEVTLTDQIFPDPASDGVALFAEGGPARLVRLDVWELASAWPSTAR
ncbi:MAG: glycoside hydrolase family 32 protein [Bacteroidetes bacterium]|nr:MAG: glycoside hydrolase family 32 protein [Bacteroidota bacterium]